MNLYLLLCESPRRVTDARAPRPTVSAARMALLPLPFFPTMKLTDELKSISSKSWQKKFRTKIFAIFPAPLIGLCEEKIKLINLS